MDRCSVVMIRAAGNPEDQGWVPANWADAIEAAAEALSGTGPDRIAVIGGARLTNESQYAWTKLAKGVLGTDNVDAQLGDGLPAETILGLPRATIDRACTPGGTIVLLGPDPKEELGSLYLRLRHAVVHDGATLIELTPSRRASPTSPRTPSGSAPARPRAWCGPCSRAGQATWVPSETQSPREGR